MTAPGSRRGARPPIRFADLAAALLARAHLLVPAWLPGGTERGGEYTVHSVWRSEKTASLSVRLSGERAGHWADFGGDRRGRDLISLYAAIHDCDQGEAALQLARQEGLEVVAGIEPAKVSQTAPAPPPPPEAVARRAPEPEGWTTQIPVPEHAPAPTFRHHHRRPEDLEHLAAYRSDGHLLGYVVRFRTSDGGKDVMPYTWCLSARDGAARWHWRQWDEPRPLYLPAGRSPDSYYREGKPRPTVVLVEGEKKADALQALLDAGGGAYMVASWPGGCKAWAKAAWGWLDGCSVLLWPDCDGKRQLLSKAERDACADDLARQVLQQAKPFLPPEKQPGMAAMLSIGARLRDEHMCQVQILPIPDPGAVTDGWDCADAISSDGWDRERVLEFFGQAQPLPSAAGSSRAGGASGGGGGHSGDGGGGAGAPPSGDGRDTAAGEADGDDEFQAHLEYMAEQMGCKVYQLPVTRKLLIAGLRKAPALRHCLGFDEMIGGPVTRQPWPWRSEPGPLADGDDLALGDWISSTYKLKAASRAALAEAIETVADANRFHPIKGYLQGLTWDRKPRETKWLIHVLGKDPAAMSPALKRYYELAGTFILRGLVLRAMQPGCKFDYSPVLEGLTGMGKSTMIETLVGKDHFSDTHFDIGTGKDGMEQVAGLWAYELGELTAFKRADSEQIKQFFSSKVDRYRGAYGRYVSAHPRQLVIFCSTNKRRYLYDLTGNRRFWPFWVDKPINLDWLAKWRDQLFAEAFAAVQAGERCHPTREEEDAYFVPEQRKRLVHTAVHARLYELLTREGSATGDGKLLSDVTVHLSFITLDRAIAILGADAAKSTSMLESQVNAWFDAYGWKYGREGGGQRRYGFKQPSPWPPPVSDEEDEAGGNTPPAPADPSGAGGDGDGGADDAPI